MRYIAVFLLAVLTACSSTLPQQITPPPLDTKAITAPLASEIASTREATRIATDRLAQQVEEMRKEVHKAATSASQSAFRFTPEPAKAKTIVREKIVPVADAIFKQGDREDILSRALAQTKKLDESLAQLRDLAAKLEDMRKNIDGLKEFASSPADFAQTHGPSGLLMLLMSVVTYFLGKRKREI